MESKTPSPSTTSSIFSGRDSESRFQTAPPSVSPQWVRDFQKLHHAKIIKESERSLDAYLANVVIDCRPDPVPWHTVIEPWQIDIIRPLVPAIEQMAGLRSDYSGPRKFWYGLSKGHDKTGLVGRICNWACGFSKHHIKALAAAGDKDQAGLVLESIEAEYRLNPWLQERLEIKAWNVTGTGGALEIISSDAPTSSGAKADLIILDELSFWKKRDLWDMIVQGASKRPDCILIVITNAGTKGSWQDDVRQKAKRSKAWHLYESPQCKCLASWMTPEKIKEDRDVTHPGMAKRVFDNIWIDATENPLLDEDQIIACEHPESLWPTYYTRFGYAPDLYVGVDIGRTRDLTVCWTIEVVQEEDEVDDDGRIIHGRAIAWTREIAILEKMKFRSQFNFLKTRITRNVIKCNIDMGGIGMQLTEELSDAFPGKVEGVALGAGRQGELALGMKNHFEAGTIRLPVGDVDLRLDLQQVSTVETGPGGLPIIRTERSDVGHADRFWALALALRGIPTEQGPRYYRAPRGVPSRFSRVS